MCELCFVALIMFLTVFLIAQLPYVISDVRDRQCRRACFAAIGLRQLNYPDYKGWAAAPEVELVSDVFARVPIVLIVGTAAAAGLDEAIMGEQENSVGIAICAFLLFFTGGGASSATYNCVVEGTKARAEHGVVGTIANSLGGVIDNWVGRLASLSFHGIDALTLSVVVSGIAMRVEHVQLAAWLLSAWVLCGVIPTLLAPPPMPTIRPSIPAQGWKWWMHRTIVSVIMSAFPPTEYMPLLNRKKQLIWSFFAFVRTALLVTTAVIWPPPSLHAADFGCSMTNLIDSMIATTGPPCRIEDTYQTYQLVYVGSVTTLLMAVKRLDGTSAKVDEEMPRSLSGNRRGSSNRGHKKRHAPEVGDYMVMV